MRLVKGISETKVRGIIAARKDGPFRSVCELARRSGASRAVLARLAAADAFRSMGLDRREALWEVLALDDAHLPLFATLEEKGDILLFRKSRMSPFSAEAKPRLATMPIDQRVVQDYDTMGLSLEAHPMGLVRPQLDVLRVMPAEKLQHTRHGRRVRVAGLVLVRQRPGTASGIVFITLEDETDIANLVVRPRIFERYRQVANGAVALMVDGIVERQGRVIHVQATRLTDLSKALAPVRVPSRDFH